MAQWLTNERYGNGSDGVLTISSDTPETPVDASCSGTSGTTSLSATNASFQSGQIIMIHQSRGTGAGAWELNVIASYVAGTITTKYALANTYTDSGASQAQVRVLKQYSSVTINSGKTYTVKAWDNNVGGILAFCCNGPVTVTGTISANGGNGADTLTGGSGGGYIGGIGADNPGYGGYQGEGTSGTGSSTTAANANGGGASTGNGAGGAGGHAGGGADGVTGSNHGLGGSASGDAANLTTILFGGAGGGGGSAGGASHAGGGGAGGGIIVIIARNITVTGAIIANGGNGGNISLDERGGAGAGGAILLKGQSIVMGSNLITANGSTTPNTAGAGRIHIDYASSISGTTSPTVDSSTDITLGDLAVGYVI